MSTILTKEYDNKQSKYTYNISNLYSVPLFIALRFAFIIMSYVLVCLFIESIAYAHKVDLNLPKSDCIYLVMITLCVSIIMFAVYLYIEKFSQLSNTWNSYRSESANKRSFYLIMIVHFAFICLLFYGLNREDSFSSFFSLELDSSKESPKMIWMLLFGLFIIHIISITSPSKESITINTTNNANKNKSKILVHQISYTIAFIAALVFC